MPIWNGAITNRLKYQLGDTQQSEIYLPEQLRSVTFAL